MIKKNTFLVVLVFICTSVTACLYGQADSILYHDNSMESQWGSSSNGDIFRCFVRFTPPVYPANLIGMRAFLRNADANSVCRWVVYTDPAGSAQGGVNLTFYDPVTFINPSAGGISNQAYSAYKDLSANPVTVTSGDLYIGVSQYLGWFGMAIDIAPNSAIAPDRQWIQQYGYWSTLANNAYYGQFGITAFFTSFTTITEDVIDRSVHVFPNPASDKVSIIVPFIPDNAAVKIYNDMGILLLLEELRQIETSIDISNFQNGVYNIVVIFNDHILFRKVIKL